jgi:hypothetical protein
MKIIYRGSGMKSAIGRFVDGGIYEMPDEIAKEYLKRAGFELYQEYNYTKNLGLAQQEFVEKIIKNTKKEEK